MFDIGSLLGREAGDDVVTAFIDSLDEDPQLIEQDERTSLRFERAGLLLTSNRQDRISVIHVTAQGVDRWSPALRTSFTPEQVHAVLGPASLAKPPTGGLLASPAWDRYDGTVQSLHIQYTGDGQGIAGVTWLFPQPPPAERG